MLDSFIIQRIRRERESQKSARIPLRIEDTIQRRPRPEREVEEEKPERGVVIIDFTI